MNRILIFIALAGLFSSCDFLRKRPTRSSEEVQAKQSMLEADRAFSKMSEEKGLRRAFMENIDSVGVMLRPGYMPIKGADAIDFIMSIDDNASTMSWEPTGAEISASGDLGFTYGIYTIKAAGSDSLQKGTYVSIWRKQPNGVWKFVLDSGNEGISQ